MSIEERNRIVALERRVEQLEHALAKLLQSKIEAEQPKTLKLPEKKSA